MFPVPSLVALHSTTKTAERSPIGQAATAACLPLVELSYTEPLQSPASTFLAVHTVVHRLWWSNNVRFEIIVLHRSFSLELFNSNEDVSQ